MELCFTHENNGYIHVEAIIRLFIFLCNGITVHWTVIGQVSNSYTGETRLTRFEHIVASSLYLPIPVMKAVRSAKFVSKETS